MKGINSTQIFELIRTTYEQYSYKLQKVAHCSVSELKRDRSGQGYFELYSTALLTERVDMILYLSLGGLYKAETCTIVTSIQKSFK